MSTVAEITNALSDLSIEELQKVERALISIYRQRKTELSIFKVRNQFREVICFALWEH